MSKKSEQDLTKPIKEVYPDIIDLSLKNKRANRKKKNDKYFKNKGK